jgi:hypothetical protein
MKGQLVVVKDVNGVPLVRRLWDCSASGAYILSEEEWEKKMSGQQSLDPVGFPMNDVFRYDENAKAALLSPEFSWDVLTPFSRDARIAA